jgi:Flp pilus assembly protein TadG
LKSEKGQASVLIGMMMLTFIMFFAFVVNVGMLVNAKINLQNAADLAAYAGAATQARQLNQISYLNYEMRRQYKKFLFRYYVMGNFAQKSSRQNAPTHRLWSPDPNPSNGRPLDYKVPAVCVIFNSADQNWCPRRSKKSDPGDITATASRTGSTASQQLRKHWRQ